MLTVATSNILSGPTRLLFPRAAGSVGEAAAFPFSLLGAFLPPYSSASNFKLVNIDLVQTR